MLNIKGKNLHENYCHLEYQSDQDVLYVLPLKEINLSVVI